MFPGFNSLGKSAVSRDAWHLNVKALSAKTHVSSLQPMSRVTPEGLLASASIWNPEDLHQWTLLNERQWKTFRTPTHLYDHLCHTSENTSVEYVSFISHGMALMRILGDWMPGGPSICKRGVRWRGDGVDHSPKASSRAYQAHKSKVPRAQYFSTPRAGLTAPRAIFSSGEGASVDGALGKQPFRTRLVQPNGRSYVA